MPSNPYPNPVEPDGSTPIPRTAPYNVSSFMNPIYGIPLRGEGIGYGSSQYGSPVPMNLRRTLGKSKTTDQFGKVTNVKHQKRIYQAGEQFSKSQSQSAGGLREKLKYIDWSNPYKTQDVSQDGVVYCPEDAGEVRLAYAQTFNSQRGESFNSGLGVSGIQDCIGVSACDDKPLLVKLEEPVIYVRAVRDIPLPVSGSIIVSNLDEISSISVDNFPTVQAVSGDLSLDASATLNVSGSIGVNNLAEVSSIKVNNLSEVSSVGVNNLAQVSSLAVNNFPSTQAVSGSIGVNNLSQVSSVGVNNFPSGFVASGTVLDNILTKNTEIDVVLDSSKTVLDNILTKNTEIDTVLDNSKTVQDNILTKNTEIDTVLDNILLKNTQIEVIVDANKAVLTNLLAKNTEIDTALDLVKTNSDESVDNTANLLTLKRQVTNATPAGLEIQTGTGGLTVSSLYSSKNVTLLSVLIDLDTAGGSPVTNTTLVSAGGAGTRISVYGWNLSMLGTTAGTLGNWAITNGDVAGGKFVSAGMVATTTPTHQCKDLTLPLSCDDNTALKITTTETSGNIYLYGTVQYRIETI